MAAPEAPLFFQGVARSSAAFRLLKQMGWQEGEGLGKEKQGIREHLRVSKKSDNAGLGVDAQQKAAANWTFNTTVFDNILKNLKVIVADTSQEGDNDEQNEAAAHDLEHTKSSPSKKLTRPQGRYKKREEGKLLKGKAQADLDAILGLSNKPPRNVWPVPNESRATVKKSTMLESSCVPPERLAEDNDTRPEVCSSAVTKDDQLLEETPVTIPVDWWGTQFGFVPAGALQLQTRDRKITAGLEAIQSTKTRTSFCEQDQEDLYKLVQDKATKGRQGLGIADRPKKIGGASWKGQKVILDNSDDDAESEEILDVQENTSGAGDAVHKMGECKRKADSDGENGRKSKRSRQVQKFKWKRLCAQLLKEAPAHTMRIKDLQRLIVEESYLYIRWSSNGIQQSASLHKGKLKEKLMKSSKFVIEGKRVSLATAS